MARTKNIFGQLRSSDLIAINSLVTVIPIPAIKECMATYSKRTIRKRKLSVEFLIYYVIFLSIYYTHSTSEVLKYILNGMSSVLPNDAPSTACEAAISQARSRLGDQVLHHLFKLICQPMADANNQKPWAFYKGHRLVAIDGSDVDLQDEKAIRQVYPIANDGGKNQHPCPKLRFNTLMEIGTRAIIDAEIANTRDENGNSKTLTLKDDSEAALADALLQRLASGMLVIGDRFYSCHRFLMPIVKQGSNFLVRAKDNMKLIPIKYLKDGSYLAKLKNSAAKRRNDELQIVRVIEYKIFTKDKTIVSTGRLITSLLDDDAYPASELIELYHERWEVEIGYDELKTHILNGALKNLRSKTPVLARQEFWGWLLAHYVVRKVIYDASEVSGRDPDTISFTGTIEIIRRHVGAALFPPKAKS
jgi:hypothetical protein